MDALGVRELFVEAGALAWGAGGTVALEPVDWYLPPRRTRATLVVTGDWPEEARGAAAARALIPALEALGAEAATRRLVAVGIHFDLTASLEGETLEEYGKFLGQARRQLAPELAVSVSLPERWLEVPQVRRVAGGASFLVPFLYGQRPGEIEQPSAWDLRGMAEGLRAVDELGRPFLLGVVTLGTGTVVGPRGERIGSSTAIGLHHLAQSVSLEAVPGATLQALDRQVYSFEAKAPVRMAGLAVPRGGTVRLVGTSTAHLARVVEQAQGMGLERHLGELFFRLPAAGEELSLDAIHLMAALGGGATVPEPELSATLLQRRQGRWLLRLSLENRNQEASTLSLLDHNLAEVTVEGGVFGSVDVGDFGRWELLARTRGGGLARSLRGATVLRLYVPVLPSGARLESGPVEVYFPARSEPRLTLSARFLAPYGQEASFGPVSWEPPGSE